MNSAESSCVGKVPFENFTLANAVVKRYGNDRMGRMAYHCEHCHQWHVGTNNKAESRSTFRMAKARRK